MVDIHVQVICLNVDMFNPSICLIPIRFKADLFKSAICLNADMFNYRYVLGTRTITFLYGYGYKFFLIDTKKNRLLGVQRNRRNQNFMP